MAEESDLHRRMERVEICLFGDPNDKDDKGMRADLRELITLARDGGIAFKVVAKIVMWMGGGIVSLWAAWDWIVAHLPKAAP